MGNKALPVIDNEGRVFSSAREAGRYHHCNKTYILQSLKQKGYCNVKGITLRLVNTTPTQRSQVENKELLKYSPEEIQDFLEARKIEGTPFELYDFQAKRTSTGSKYAVALFSDAHIEEVVNPSQVLGLNEYNPEIAKRRIESYFQHLAECLQVDGVDTLIFACLGDMISGYIHDELAQTNELSPLEAIYEAQNILVSGLKFLVEKSGIHHLKFIGICGNHSRSTKKIQHSNGYRMSYEWLMYKNIEKICGMLGLPIEFAIPESELAIVNAPDRRRFIFMHGFQIKGGGTNTVCGIYPALNRLAMKYDRTFHQDRIFLGHFHSCVSLPNAVVNGSIIGYSAYSLSNGFSCEEPAQMYILYGTEIGEILSRKIYCR